MSEVDRDLYRQILFCIFLWLYVAFIVVLISIGIESGFGFVEGLGIGAVIGVMTAMLKDGWQFFYRKGSS